MGGLTKGAWSHATAVAVVCMYCEGTSNKSSAGVGSDNSFETANGIRCSDCMFGLNFFSADSFGYTAQGRGSLDLSSASAGRIKESESASNYSGIARKPEKNWPAVSHYEPCEALVSDAHPDCDEHLRCELLQAYCLGAS